LPPIQLSSWDRPAVQPPNKDTPPHSDEGTTDDREAAD
jgi:hypothetical protein